jgi:hypothetical protein
MKLTPKAHRFVAEAIRDLPDARARDRLRAWIQRSPDEVLPPDIASLTLTALERFETWLTECLRTPKLDDDRQAEIINDIRFIQAIESDFRKEGVHPAPVA